VAEHTDLFLYDLKIMDPSKHRKWTGVTNEKILKNLKALADTGAKIIIRIPLIGGVNDDAENIETTARFVAGLSGVKKEVNLLPYHKIAQTKYQKLGRPEDFQYMEEPSREIQLQAMSIFQKYGLSATIGG
jgi:pyruvate formate lyase activating enzyme